jgi:hypothetical protein
MLESACIQWYSRWVLETMLIVLVEFFKATEYFIHFYNFVAIKSLDSDHILEETQQ